MLPPGQTGDLPPDANGTDQIKLYDGLTPLFGDVGRSDLKRFFKTERFDAPKGGKVTRPRKGLRIRRDRFGVPHINGRTRADVLFGAGWVTAQDRGLFIEAIRGPARISALDVPGIDAFGLASSLKRFEPSKRTERFLRSQQKPFRRLGRKGRRILRDVDAYIAGINAFRRRTGEETAPWKREDVIAAASLIGAVFGKGGGEEVRNSELMAQLQRRLGAVPGRKAFGDLRQAADPETTVSIPGRFGYTTHRGRGYPGSPVIDPGSASASAKRAARAAASVRRPMSNSLLVGRSRSETGRPFAVMGPQVGYFYPQFLMEMDLHGGGIDARGAAFPGVSLYVLLGRGKDYAWSATSAGSDNSDQYLERLCNPDGSPPTRGSTHYVYKGSCKKMGRFFAGVLKGPPDRRVTYRTTVHGPVSGTVTVQGRPYAVTLKRSTRGREAMSALGFSDLNTNKVRSAKDFARVMNQVEFTFNWSYVDNRDIAFFSSGRLPVRPKRLNPSLPTLGTGEYEWRGFLSRARHPQAINPKRGVIVNWNNKPARGFGAADDQQSYGPVHRVDLFTGFAKKLALHDLVGIMNRAATQDLRAREVWPEVAAVLRTGPAPNARTQAAADQVTRWIRRDASRLDRDLDGNIDHPGAAVLDAAWPQISRAVLSPVLGPEAVADGGALDAVQGPDNGPNPGGSSFGSGWYSHIDKDLRSLLGRKVRGPYSRRYCGAGDLAACRDSLWEALRKAADELAAEQGPRPAAWRADARAERIVFEPGLLGAGTTMRWTNRPTFQQVIDFRGHRARRKRLPARGPRGLTASRVPPRALREVAGTR